MCTQVRVSVRVSPLAKWCVLSLRVHSHRNILRIWKSVSMSPLTKKQLVYKGVCLLVKRQLIHINVSKLLTELVSKEPIVNIGYVC